MRLRLSSLVHALTLALTLFVTAACGKLYRANAGGQDSLVVFENLSLSQVTLYAVRPGQGGASVRVGTIMPGRTETVRVPVNARGPGGFGLAAKLLASNAEPRTGTITMGAGDRVHVRLTSDGRQLIVLPPRQQQ